MAAPTAAQTAIFGSRIYLGRQVYVGAGTLAGGAYDPLVTYDVQTFTSASSFATLWATDSALWLVPDSSLDGTTLTLSAPNRTSLQPIVVDCRGYDITFEGNMPEAVGANGGIVVLNVRIHPTGTGFQNGAGWLFRATAIRNAMIHCLIDPNDDDDSIVCWNKPGYMTWSWCTWIAQVGGGSGDRHHISIGHSASSPDEQPIGPFTLAHCVLTDSENRGPQITSGKLHCLNTYYDTWGDNGGTFAMSIRSRGIDPANALFEGCIIQPTASSAKDFCDPSNYAANILKCDSGENLINPSAVAWTGAVNEQNTASVWDPSASYPYQIDDPGSVLADYATSVLVPRAQNVLIIEQGGTLDGVTDANVSGKTLTLTLRGGQTWLAAGASFDAARAAILDAVVGYLAGTTSQVLTGDTICSTVANVVRTSSTVVTITMDTNPTIAGDVEVHFEGTAGIDSGDYLIAWNPQTIIQTGTPAATPPQPNAGGTLRGRRLLAV